jgi:hypothetical protein
MKRILGIALALSLTVAVGSASAHHNGSGNDFGSHHGWHHHHHGFVIAGTNACFNGTKNDDGTYTGDLTLTLKSHDHSNAAKARASHHDSTDTNDNGTDNTVTKTFHLDGTDVKFADSVTDANGDGTVDFSDVQPTDVVVLKVFGGHRFRSHGAGAHKSCDNGSGNENSGENNNPSSSTTPTIKKAFVFRPQQTAADPDQKD